jgi:uncharacterized protein (TIGR00369 family)
MTEPAVTAEEVNHFLVTHVPFCAQMDITCDRVALDVGVTRFTYHDRWTRPRSIVGGPTLMALADVAVYVAIFSRTGIVPLTVTNDFKINFLRPAIAKDVLAEARLLKLGRRIAYAAVDIYEEHDRNRLIAHATSSYILPDQAGPQQSPTAGS